MGGGQARGRAAMDGVNDHLIIPHSSALNIGGRQITLSAWIRFASTGAGQTVVGNVNADNSHTAPYFTYMLRLGQPNRPMMFLAVGGGTSRVNVLSEQTLIAGNWYLLTGVYDGTRLKIYVNGILREARPDPRAHTTHIVGAHRCRRDSKPASERISGRRSHLNRALSDSQSVRCQRTGDLHLRH